MPKRNKTITRTLQIQIMTPANVPYNEKLIASLDKKQYAVIVYLLRGLKIRIQRFKESKPRIIEDSRVERDKEFEREMSKGVKDSF